MVYLKQRIFMRTLLLSLALMVAVRAQPAVHGPDVGAKIPKFSAKDQNGVTQNFETVKGPKGAMIVFYRSADWCPYCKSQLVELQESRETLRKAGLGLAAISFDTVEVLANFAKRKGIEFPLLSDPDSKIIQSFGILNEEVPKDNPFYGIPHPVTYIVDPAGVVVSRKFDED